jgi:hypothetical protein
MKDVTEELMKMIPLMITLKRHMWFHRLREREV